MFLKKTVFTVLIFFSAVNFIFSQNSTLILLQNGIELYGQGQWDETIHTLRPIAESTDKTVAAEALFWIALAEQSAGLYQNSLMNLDTLEKTDPESHRIGELNYHRGRALYSLGRFDEAIYFLVRYSDSFGIGLLSANDQVKKSAALYWIGEILFTMGQFERAADVFSYIVINYPLSTKFEASSNRLALIDQKKIETELLELLKWSHEESLRIMEEYQRRERAYDQAILSYQRRINDMLKDTRLSDLETANAQYRQQLAVAEDRIRSLENRLTEMAGISGSHRNAENSPERLQSLRSSAEEVRDELMKALGAL